MSKVDEFLEHYGIPGMKWGVRKQSKYSKSSGKSGGSKSRNLKDIPDDELRKIVNRMQLEKQYIDLVKQTSTTGSGKKFANDIMKSAARQQLTSVVVKGSTVAASKAVDLVMKK